MAAPIAKAFNVWDRIVIPSRCNSCVYVWKSETDEIWRLMGDEMLEKIIWTGNDIRTIYAMLAIDYECLNFRSVMRYVIPWR